MDWTLWRPALLFVLALAVATFAILGVRGQTSHVPPREFNKGMWDQPKAKAQGTSAVFADGRVNRTPPKGTIAWGRSSLHQDVDLAFDPQAAYARGRMPMEPTLSLLERGEEIYNRFCMFCHGASGDGQGITTRFGMNPPPSYADERLRKLSDGEIFRIITEGKNTMGPLGGRIAPQDRWAAVAWVRVLQRAAHASLDDVPVEEQRRLATEEKK
ncbi:MAG: c-type cytochrome [Planctomycetota bacterium]|jgi:cytochrome c5